MARTEGLVHKAGAANGPRDALIRRGRMLEYFTIAYNCLEGVLSVIAGLAAGSVSLIGFGLDSFIEVTSATALVWRLSRDHDPKHREAAERRSLRIVGVCFVALAAYIAFESASSLVRRQAPEQTVFGILAQQITTLFRRLAICRTRNNLSQQGLDVPGALHKFTRQPIQELRMRGQIPLRAEVLSGSYQPRAEYHLPESIHGDSRGERIRRID